ncbi:MAG TPA: hypothetical protein VHH73_05730 [Verrucomicrobiae bacterium]|nr:hypothetical protein [Verrucomicrobiae bacterium]
MEQEDTEKTETKAILFSSNGENVAARAKIAREVAVCQTTVCKIAVREHP